MTSRPSTPDDAYGALKSSMGLGSGASCDGHCEEHRGDIRRVHVTDPKDGHDWGLFFYCDEAVEADTRNNLKVEAA
jgi:hypothetical protein